MLNISSKYKKFFKDLFINIFGSGIMVIILQILVYPFLNNKEGPDFFGEILLIMGIVNIIGVAIGSSLNNIRLKLYTEYSKKNIEGDFSILLIYSTFINIILTVVLLNYMAENLSNIDIFILTSITVLTMLRSYLTVEFRIKLQYLKILTYQLFYSFGLGVGLILVSFSFNWQFAFLIGEIVAFIYLFRTTKVLREPLKSTSNFKKTTNNYSLLLLSNSFNNILQYIDRIIIFPILGAYQVAVFFAATLVGRMSSFVLVPISGVVLSYLARKSNAITKRFFVVISFSLIIFSIVISIISIYSSTLILPLIYSDLYKDTLSILLVANIAAIIKAISSIPLAIVLKYSATYHQTLIQISYFLVYLFFGMTFMSIWGLIGFCYGILIAELFKFILIFLFGYKALSKAELS
ncbi:hypothetical protein CR205_16650 [Alteribacter lacisalsi]|uniref:Lipopolysaccharide biosynthesis protein n=1 Tax=Alteribacter lacisalsi TaxID=2045244 RepID=A0A2W0HGI3_9BACI|nr:hypothetical protein [Alteribacter lacisalsi]PYZ96002.1 hypothetical protein CR205_16650 [Alteribacter lacisalsi]